MKYERFEDLPVWRTAIELALKAYRLTRDRFFNQPGDLRDQLRRASLSASNNIAEGFERLDGGIAGLLVYRQGIGGRDTLGICFTERFPEAGHL